MIFVAIGTSVHCFEVKINSFFFIFVSFLRQINSHVLIVQIYVIEQSHLTFMDLILVFKTKQKTCK